MRTGERNESLSCQRWNCKAFCFRLAPSYILIPVSLNVFWSHKLCPFSLSFHSHETKGITKREVRNKIRIEIVQLCLYLVKKVAVAISHSPFRALQYNYYNLIQRRHTVLLRSRITTHLLLHVKNSLADGKGTRSCTNVLYSCVLPDDRPVRPETCGSWCVVILWLW
jgi:hypothetical protein